MTRTLRSWLFVPGDSERKMTKAREVGADALILDLEDAVSDGNKGYARELTTQFLLEHRNDAVGPELWVRVNPLSTPYALADLVAVTGGAPAGLVIPKITGPGEVSVIGHQLDVLEASHGLAPGSVSLLPVVTETPAAALNLAGIGRDLRGSRVRGLTWGAEDLSAALGASTNLAPDGTWAMTYQLVRAQTLMAASVAEVQAIETVHVDLHDLDALAVSTRGARSEGFSGRIAVHPGQVEVINMAFTPSAQEIEYAERVVDAFGSVDTGTVALEGQMLDAPHLRRARQVLENAAR